jgi:hypothetical protein
MLVSYNLECSKALTVSNSKKTLLFTVDTNDTDVLSLCKHNEDVIVNRLLKSNIVVNSETDRNDRIKIVYLPHRFDIIIKNRTAYFYLKGN